jgi:lycopene elongase/hydratase (dihydrobisanhydrobacterioruberin-forming)
MILTDIKISRPLKWPLLIISFVIGTVSADISNFFWPALAVFAFYFTYPANLLLYGINDIFDMHADKKAGHPDTKNLVTPANKWRVLNTIILWNLPFCVVWLADEMPTASKISLLGFITLGIFYSAKPIRAKSKPVLDALFNALYIFPGLFAFGLLEYRIPSYKLLLAAVLWLAAIHVYTTIPKVKYDKRAGIQTTATLLRPLATLIFCIASIAGAIALSFPTLRLFSIAAGGLYILIFLITFVREKPDSMSKLYKYFPLVNISVGVGLIYYILTVVKKA